MLSRCEIASPAFRRLRVFLRTIVSVVSKWFRVRWRKYAKPKNCAQPCETVNTQWWNCKKQVSLTFPRCKKIGAVWRTRSNRFSYYWSTLYLKKKHYWPIKLRFCSQNDQPLTNMVLFYFAISLLIQNLRFILNFRTVTVKCFDFKNFFSQDFRIFLKKTTFYEGVAIFI